jgi:hypothetical protein
LKNTDIIGGIVAVLVIIMVIGALPALVEVMNQDIDTHIGGPSSVETASYIIYQDGDYTIAKNGTTGRIEMRSTNASYLMSEIVSLGGTIVIQSGNYELDSEILLVNDTNIIGVGNPTLHYANDAGTMFYTDQHFNGSMTLTANSNKLNKTILLNDASGLSPDDYIKIVSTAGVLLSGQMMAKGSVEQVLSIVGNAVTLTRTLDDDYKISDTTISKMVFTSNISFSGINFLGNGTEKQNSIIELWSAKNVHIDKCTFSDGGRRAVFLSDSHFVTVSNSLFENIFSTGLGYSISVNDCSEAVKIVDNMFRYYGRHYIATGTHYETGDFPGGWFRDLYISGNSFESSQYDIGNEAINTHAGAKGPIVIVDNTFRYCGKGIDLTNTPAIISNNYFIDTTNPVDIAVSTIKVETIISNNRIESTGMTGTSGRIILSSQNIKVSNNLFIGTILSVQSHNITIEDNSFVNVLQPRNAVTLAGTSGNYLRDIMIRDNSFKNCSYATSYYALKADYVKDLSVQGNTFVDSGRVYFNYASGLSFQDNYILRSAYHGTELLKSENVTIDGNVYKEIAGSRAISLTSAAYAATNVLITGNSILSKAVYNDGSYTNVRVVGNAGWKTEASGSATILNGQTYLSAAPTKVVVTSGTGGTYKLYVTTIGASTFRIYADSAVSGDQVVYWYAMV